MNYKMKASTLTRVHLVFLTLVTLTILASQFSVGDAAFLDSYKRMRAVNRYRETVRLEKECRLREIIDQVIKTNAMKANATVLSDIDQQFDTISSFGTQRQEEQENEEEVEKKEENILSRPIQVNEIKNNLTMSAIDHFRKVFG